MRLLQNGAGAARYRGHTPLSGPARVLVAADAALRAILDPRDARLVGVVGEATGGAALAQMRRRMLRHPVGRAVLRDRPLITSASMPLERLRAMPPDSLGASYARFLAANHFCPDERAAVQFVDDPEDAYVMTRYRQVHDIWHVLYALPPSLLGEVALKWVEAIQTGLPMCALAAIGGSFRLKPSQRAQVREHVLPWAASQVVADVDLMSVYYERELDKPLPVLRRELGIVFVPNVSVPDDMRAGGPDGQVHGKGELNDVRQ
ncbi:hypothetical protein AB1Y20_009232 [Prymnesium parvum]|uniref:Ubiquinone biosynthesis protein COQ4 homolog, mitochondrial n=1 Tax=Prymnesium parvum TaxID=97485 RepID=A0AB34K0V4_PRYPA